MAQRTPLDLPGTRPPAIIRPFAEFFRLEASGGILLLLAAASALLLANSPMGPRYFDFWNTPFTVGGGDWALTKPLILWVNDGLMAIFFFVVGLEIKREILIGELSSFRKAVVPIMAASLRHGDGGSPWPPTSHLFLQDSIMLGVSLAGAAALCGVGFTMSLFIGSLAFEVPAHIAHAKVGILLGSALSAVLGAILLRMAQKDQPAG